MNVRVLLVKRDVLAHLDETAKQVLDAPHPSLHAEVVDVFRRLGIQECELADLDCKVRAINTLLEG